MLQQPPQPIPATLPSNAVILQVTDDALHLLGGTRIATQDLHEPYFLAVPDRQTVETLSNDLRHLARQGRAAWSRVCRIGEPLRRASFANPGRSFQAVPIYVDSPGDVSNAAAAAFRDAACWVVEHGLPYAQRVQADLVDSVWILDTRGMVCDLRVLSLETDGAGAGEPFRWVAWTHHPYALQSTRDLDQEAFTFDATPLAAAGPCEVREASTPAEEARLLLELVRVLRSVDVVCAHGAHARVVPRLVKRVERLLNDESAGLSSEEAMELQGFLRDGVRRWEAFVAGKRRPVASVLPVTLDSELAMEWLGIGDEAVAGSDVDERGAAQSARAQWLVVQVLPLAFLANLGVEELVTSGHTRLWDQMALLRCMRDGKTFPAPVRPSRFLAAVQARAWPWDRRSLGRTVRQAVERGEVEPELHRVAMQGPQAPAWIDYGGALVDEHGRRRWRLPGGFMVRPQDLDAHGIPWRGVVEADAEAMYPTLVGALNASPDAVRLARAGEAPEAWAWWPSAGAELEGLGYATKAPVAPFEEGSMVGLRVQAGGGAMNRAMQGVLAFSRRLWTAAEAGDEAARRMYAAVKRLRSAGTHGVLGAWKVQSCQFHPGAAAWITTEGQRVNHAVFEAVRGEGFRVGCVNTDGVWVLPADKDAAAATDHAELLVDVLEGVTRRVQRRLRAPHFSLHVRRHDVVAWLGHNERLILEQTPAGVVPHVQGSVLTGRDKPQRVRGLMRDALAAAARCVPADLEPEAARCAFREAIIRACQGLGSSMEDADLSSLILVQKVRPPSDYKPCPDNRNLFRRRAEAVELLMGRCLDSETAVSFLVCMRALPGLEEHSKTARMPTAYMWPADCVQPRDVDLSWYNDYAAGALRDLAAAI